MAFSGMGGAPPAPPAPPGRVAGAPMSGKKAGIVSCGRSNRRHMRPAFPCRALYHARRPSSPPRIPAAVTGIPGDARARFTDARP